MAAYRKLALWEKLALWVCGLGLLAAAALTGPLFKNRKGEGEKKAPSAVELTIKVQPVPPEEPPPVDRAPDGRLQLL